jgi:hypothetical protein
VNPASEEDRHTQRTFEVMRGFFLAKQSDIEKVIPEVHMHGNGICQKEAVSGAKIDRKPVIAREPGRAKSGADI